MPDAVIFIDLDPENAYDRGGAGGDRMELENKAFHRAVYEGFKEIERTEKNFYPIIPATRGETFEKILGVLEKIGFIRR
jgi:thymidylate kinase